MGRCRLASGSEREVIQQRSSSGPSAENGGELGWFAKNEMVPEFAEAAFAVAPGAYTKDPVKTQFGWHVIKVENRDPEEVVQDLQSVIATDTSSGNFNTRSSSQQRSGSQLSTRQQNNLRNSGNNSSFSGFNSTGSRTGR